MDFWLSNIKFLRETVNNNCKGLNLMTPHAKFFSLHMIDNLVCSH